MRYLITLGIRVLCFVLMVVITPYGWYTWVFAAAAVLLPYIAVVVANVGSDVRSVEAENPERALPAAPERPVAAAAEPGPTVIRLQETPQVQPRRPEQPPREPEA